MKLFDVNVLIYAHRSDQAHHNFFRTRLDAALAGPETCGLTTAVATGFVRIVTQPNFPNGPTPLPQALAVIETLTSPGGCQWIHPGSRHWNLTAELCRLTRTVGKSVSDASHAALAIEHGGTWVSRDSDFERFIVHGLRWEQWEP
ncbi:MAG: PIN domain-containing protein [Verrucomicrobiales bacterium]|nr:PIN domain-containing protein [Verrucomicrobiales bacterium]HQW28052.1 PIN domain-containing protein [Verrucomicrobiales bacterium]